MKIASGLVSAEFVSRPNRFVAQVLINGQPETVHVKNTGRCREILQPGTRVWLGTCRSRRKPENPVFADCGRKTGPGSDQHRFFAAQPPHEGLAGGEWRV
ncbi:hypothetical protein [Faecalibaculum rodentium]|uniref:hypothetical protein n=1 Tax=Faecalibaculum rodentium TaxID=1702221 RepID=UPI003306E3A0